MWLLALAVEADHGHAELAVDIGAERTSAAQKQAAAAPAACCRNTRRVCLDMKTPLRMRSRELPTVARRPAHSTVASILTAGRRSATLGRIRFWRSFLEISGRLRGKLLAVSQAKSHQPLVASFVLPTLLLLANG